MKVATIGLDIAKHIFQVHGADAEGRPLLRRRPGRSQPAVAGDPLIRHHLGYVHLSRCSKRASFGVSSHPVES
jgi:hypothetical protein